MTRSMTGMIPVPTTDRSAWSRELRAVAALSWPLALSNLAQVAMGTTDVMMMGWLSSNTLAAGALGTNLWFIALIFGLGLLNAASPLIARDLGRDPRAVDGVRLTVRLALWSAAFAALPCWLVLWQTEKLLLAMGQDAALSAAAGIYVHVLQWALLPAWGYVVLRSFVNTLERPIWSLLIGVAAVAFNAAANWCLMLGHCGCEPMGIAGSGLAT
jgi:MATE family multidrug resistance protein